MKESNDSHPEKSVLIAFSRGRLDDQTGLVRVSDHIESCGKCRQLLDEIPPNGLENLVRSSVQDITGLSDKSTKQPTHFLAYWKPKTVDRQLQLERGIRSNQNHAASNQFGRVAKGDTVWIVTVRSGKLHFVTRIKVEHRTNQDTAAGLLRCKPRHLWEAEYHIIGARGTEMPVLDVDIHQLAGKLRFKSAAGNDRLAIGKDGAVAAQQLQTMRVLTEASADLLDDVAEEAELVYGKPVLVVPNPKQPKRRDR
ncbi:unnamed protein product [uncultured bacterium]|nr:unnamed protein product [uncultured bacterium]